MQFSNFCELIQCISTLSNSFSPYACERVGKSAAELHVIPTGIYCYLATQGGQMCNRTIPTFSVLRGCRSLYGCALHLACVHRTFSGIADMICQLCNGNQRLRDVWVAPAGGPVAKQEADRAKFCRHCYHTLNDCYYCGERSLSGIPPATPAPPFSVACSRLGSFCVATCPPACFCC